ncbi:uncharacterized protein [Penaeus vannamei]|uniref:uncharacterized protein n=1 Tax=Penaeus vannamei TaxID=6689 RepID=UPI00387F7AA6
MSKTLAERLQMCPDPPRGQKRPSWTSSSSSYSSSTKRRSVDDSPSKSGSSKSSSKRSWSGEEKARDKRRSERRESQHGGSQRWEQARKRDGGLSLGGVACYVCEEAVDEGKFQSHLFFGAVHCRDCSLAVSSCDKFARARRRGGSESSSAGAPDTAGGGAKCSHRALKWSHSPVGFLKKHLKRDLARERTCDIEGSSDLARSVSLYVEKLSSLQSFAPWRSALRKIMEFVISKSSEREREAARGESGISRGDRNRLQDPSKSRRKSCSSSESQSLRTPSVRWESSSSETRGRVARQEPPEAFAKEFQAEPAPSTTEPEAHASSTASTLEADQHTIEEGHLVPQTVEEELVISEWEGDVINLQVGFPETPYTLVEDLGKNRMLRKSLRTDLDETDIAEGLSPLKVSLEGAGEGSRATSRDDFEKRTPRKSQSVRDTRTGRPTAEESNNKIPGISKASPYTKESEIIIVSASLLGLSGGLSDCPDFVFLEVDAKDIDGKRILRSTSEEEVDVEMVEGTDDSDETGGGGRADDEEEEDTGGGEEEEGEEDTGRGEEQEGGEDTDGGEEDEDSREAEDADEKEKQRRWSVTQREGRGNDVANHEHSERRNQRVKCEVKKEENRRERRKKDFPSVDAKEEMMDLRGCGVRGKPRRSLREITKYFTAEEEDELETETRKMNKEEQQRDERLRKRRRRLKALDEVENDVRRRSMRLKEEKEEEEDLWKAPKGLAEGKEDGEDLSSPPKEYNLRSKRRHRASKEFLKKLEEYERSRSLKRFPSSAGLKIEDPPASHTSSCDCSPSFSSSFSSSPSASFPSSSSSSSSSLEECERAWDDGSAEGTEMGSPRAKDAPEDPRSIAGVRGFSPPADASSTTHQSSERSVLRHSRETTSVRRHTKERIRKSVTFAKDIPTPSPLRLPPAAAPTSVHRVMPPRDGYYYVVTYPREPCPSECPMCYFRVFPSMFALDPRSLLATTTCLGCPLTIYIVHDPRYDPRRAEDHPIVPRVVFEGGDSPCGRDRYRPRPARFQAPKGSRAKAAKEASFKPLKGPRKSPQHRQKVNKLSIRHFFRN